MVFTYVDSWVDGRSTQRRGGERHRKLQAIPAGTCGFAIRLRRAPDRAALAARIAQLSRKSPLSSATGDRRRLAPHRSPVEGGRVRGSAKPPPQAAGPDGGPFELVFFAPSGVQSFPLPAAGSVTLGRAEGCDIRIEDTSVSRQHAVLHMGPPLRLEDAGSANGIRLRRSMQGAETAEMLDTRLGRGSSVELAPGEPVNLGSALIVVRRAAPPATAAAAAELPYLVQDDVMRRLYAMAERIAKGNISVLLLGETGAGKEVLAETIHRKSSRAAGPFIQLNCAALSESLLESELFGHEKGAFTGAVRSKTGLFEAAEGGSVFLDEVGELPMTIQVKLLRVLEDRRVTPVGGLSARPIDVRFIAATNRDLTAAVASGTFRQDLFFRLDGISLFIPPLRERRGEIAALAALFAARFAEALQRPRAPEIAPETMAALTRHAWPGNVRELRNVMERAVVLCDGDVLRPEHLALDPRPPAAAAGATAPIAAASEPVAADEPADLQREMSELERRRILDALDRCAGNQTQAAALLGMPRRTFVARLGAYGVPRPRKKPG
jgi:two-component system, NtrC family, response regulator AtoC